MANERFKVTKIFQKHIKGLRQYPFSMGSFISLVAGSNETVIGTGIVPDGDSIFIQGGIPLSDEHDTPEVSLNFHICPPFIYDKSLATGLKDNV